MDRRNFITASAAIPLIATGTAVTASIPTDPHPEWLARFRAVVAHWGRLEEKTPEYKSAESEWHGLSDLLRETEAKTPAGLAAQLELAIEENWGPEETYGEEFFAVLLAGARGMS